MKKSKLTILTLTILAFSLVVSGCLKKPVADQNINSDVILNPAERDEESQDIDTSDWKTYRNEEYGLSFEYPLRSGRFPKEPVHKVMLKGEGLLVGNTAFIRVFSFDNNDPISYIESHLLSNVDKSCTVKVLEDSKIFSDDYIVYVVNFLDSDGVWRSITVVDDIDCGEYTGRGQAAYFVYSPNVPGKLLHILRYQDPSMSEEQISKFFKSVRVSN